MSIISSILRRARGPRDTKNDSSNSMFDIDHMVEVPAIEPLPAGWMSDLDLQVPYNVALHAKPPFLEIGAWIGRSTSAICAGIRDSGKPKNFDLIDFGICGVEEYKFPMSIQTMYEGA